MPTGGIADTGPRPSVESTTFTTQLLCCRWPRCEQRWWFHASDEEKYEVQRLVHEEACPYRPSNS